MKRNLEQWQSTMSPISINRTNISHLRTLNIKPTTTRTGLGQALKRGGVNGIPSHCLFYIFIEYTILQKKKRYLIRISSWYSSFAYQDRSSRLLSIGYRTPSSQCFGSNMLYRKLVLLKYKFPMQCNIIKTKDSSSSDVGNHGRFLVVMCIIFGFFLPKNLTASQSFDSIPGELYFYYLVDYRSSIVSSIQ
jgi:hypothetical protein